MKYRSDALARLNAAHLKYLAAGLMLVDHIGLLLFPNVPVLRGIGRLSMPIWCFFIAQGVLHTKSRGKYALRLLIFAVVSEPFYDLMTAKTPFSLQQQNVGFTLLLGMLACTCSHWMHEGKIPCEKLPKWLREGPFTPVVCFALMAASVVAPMILRCDYGVFGVLSILLFYLFGDNLFGLLAGCAVPNLLMSYNDLGSALDVTSLSQLGFLIRQYGSRLTIQWMAMFSFIPLLFYNGKPGKAPRWFFYIFYPMHMLALFLIYTLMLYFGVAA